jgi:hypothetical protein
LRIRLAGDRWSVWHVLGANALEHGDGRLDIMVLGVVPIARAERTPALVRRDQLRYLAELAWAPDAILCNTALRWHAESTILAVSAGIGATASEIMLSLHSDGRIAGVYAPDRPRSTTAPFLPTPQRGQRLPTSQNAMDSIRWRSRLGDRWQARNLLAVSGRALVGPLMADRSAMATQERRVDA